MSPQTDARRTALPLGVSADGPNPEILDAKQKWQWVRARAGEKVPPEKMARAAKRPRPQAGKKADDHLGLAEFADAQLADLDITGWAVLYGPSVSAGIKQQLAPLVERRRAQVNDDALFKVFDGDGGYKNGQSAEQWLTSLSVANTQVRPEKGVPFYILIVASPEEIPFDFQYELDVYWGVGRLWFPNEEDFGRYAASVIAYETETSLRNSRKLAMFAPLVTADNGAMKMLNDGLITPFVSEQFGKKWGFRQASIAGEAATKSALHEMYSATEDGRIPSIFLYASHGLLRNSTSKHLTDTMGALICQDWPGNHESPKPDHYFSSRDLASTTDLRGSVHFLCACYSCGWPQLDTYALTPTPIAPTPMMARLPQAWLALANGALAVFGHIDRAWSYSFQSGSGLDRTSEFRGILFRMMNGYRMGHATDQFNQRWNVISGALTQTIQKRVGMPSVEALHDFWIERDDARNYVLYGDPAVRLRTAELPVEV